VELAPSFLPPRLDRGGRDLGEQRAQSLLAGRVRVDGDLSLGLLEAFWMQLEEPRPRYLELVVRDCDRDSAELAPVQRNALLSFSKNPSSGR
jgi:hypothetical protein